ncbi:hypothetical protein [Cellulomonas shaoxiangyii]|uniref:Uncharacterized protein n=1 Tax=Cellulomonas shaoxiangyii TaxID=2566013 RepID=A0A4P7SKE0_9CELL|nr:hypothetical protein [Cellulomonas shaoxiangyii]QCB94650.1 hypothetical protein E5225_14870 [Cellulomonas shaoxiangyii]TGY77596.1 hypothetical protein E5226_16985 [Cellulomonas shaoxiangyii]
MSTTMWGPALDAEIAYRRERVQDALASARAPHGDREDDAPRTTAAQGTGRHASGRHASGGHGSGRGPGRRWVLPGSGAWHAAR